MKLEIQTRLAHNLKRLRKNRNLTQFELAEKANISEAMVKSIELSISWPSEKTLTNLAEALEIEIDKQSLTKAKAAIKDLFDTIGRFGR